MSRDITLLHPELQAIAEKFLAECKKQGLPVLITETLRTVDEQNKLYAQGRTISGNIVTNCKGSDYQSGHQWGVAFDFCRNVKGKEWDNSDGFYNKVGAIGKSLGLTWGGDWKSPDRPHLELAKYMPNSLTATLKQKYGTPENFKKTWSTSNTPVISKPTLRKGSTGRDVELLQFYLNALIDTNLAIDGKFGELTLGAVIKFQKANSLIPDGIVGVKTWGVLLRG